MRSHRHKGGALAQDERLQRGEIKSLRFLWKYLWPYRFRTMAALVAILFTSGSVLGIGWALKYLIDQGLSKGDHDLLNRAYEVLLVVTSLLALASYTRFFLVTWVGERAVADIRRDIYRKLLQMDIGFFETARTGELLSRLTTDTTLLQTVIGSSVSVALRHALSLTGGLILLLVTSPHLTGMVVIVVPLVVAPIIFLGRKVRLLSRESQSRVADLSAQAEEALNAMRTIQALTLEKLEEKRFMEHVNAGLAVSFRRVRTRALLTALVIALVFGAIVTVLWIGGHEVIAGRLSAGELSAFMFYSVVVAGAVASLSEVTTELQRAAGASERIAELLKLEPRMPVLLDPAPMPQVGASVLAFENVTFHYPSRPLSAALEDVSFTIEPGSTTALVGHSGAGKSTVFHMILRFYDPASGTIRLGGTDINRIDPLALRQQIGLVPQEPVIFSGTARENIRFGAPDASDAEIEEAAAKASAMEFLRQLPQGLETHLGQKGVQLSGGQRQRLAIARALVRNPGLLLLDEATSALDAENERLVQQAIERLMQGRTTLIIAHRLSTVRKADRILLFNEGKLIQGGTHAELMEKSEIYKRFVTLQLAVEPAA